MTDPLGNLDDDALRAILRSTRVIAVVGFSATPDKPSHYVAAFLQARGYRIVPVNPGLAGQRLLGETVYARLEDIPPALAVDMVDLFRRAEDVPPAVASAIRALPDLRTVWMQMGIRNAAAAAEARAHGLTVVQDRCPKVEIPRLGL